MIVDRTKLRKILLLVFGCPLALLILINCITSYIPPTESYKKAPFQFEEIFNDRMAKYGMSIDVGSNAYSFAANQTKTVPIVCADGSQLTCTYFPANARNRAIIQAITFSQKLNGNEGETIYIEQILTFMMDEFCPAITENKDVTFETITALSYNDALRVCREFLGSDAEEQYFNIAPNEGEFIAVALFRVTENETAISIRFYL